MEISKEQIYKHDDDMDNLENFLIEDIQIKQIEITLATYTHGKWYVFTDKENKEEVMEHFQDVLEALVYSKYYAQAFPNKPRINQGLIMPMKYISFLQNHCNNNLQNVDTTSLHSTPYKWKTGLNKISQT